MRFTIRYLKVDNFDSNGQINENIWITLVNYNLLLCLLFEDDIFKANRTPMVTVLFHMM